MAQTAEHRAQQYNHGVQELSEMENHTTDTEIFKNYQYFSSDLDWHILWYHENTHHSNPSTEQDFLLFSVPRGTNRKVTCILGITVLQNVHSNKY